MKASCLSCPGTARPAVAGKGLRKKKKHHQPLQLTLARGLCWLLSSGLSAGGCVSGKWAELSIRAISRNPSGAVAFAFGVEPRCCCGTDFSTSPNFQLCPSHLLLPAPIPPPGELSVAAIWDLSLQDLTCTQTPLWLQGGRTSRARRRGGVQSPISPFI